MKGFSSIDPVIISQKCKNLQEFGNDRINALPWLYGQATTIAGELIQQVFCRDALHIQYKAYY